MPPFFCVMHAAELLRSMHGIRSQLFLVVCGGSHYDGERRKLFSFCLIILDCKPMICSVAWALLFVALDAAQHEAVLCGLSPVQLCDFLRCYSCSHRCRPVCFVLGSWLAGQLVSTAHALIRSHLSAATSSYSMKYHTRPRYATLVNLQTTFELSYLGYGPADQALNLAQTL